MTFATYLDGFDVAADTIRQNTKMSNGRPYHMFITGKFNAWAMGATLCGKDVDGENEIL